MGMGVTVKYLPPGEADGYSGAGPGRGWTWEGHDKGFSKRVRSMVKSRLGGHAVASDKTMAWIEAQLAGGETGLPEPKWNAWGSGRGLGDDGMSMTEACGHLDSLKPGSRRRRRKGAA